MDILVFKFPEKIFSTHGNTMKQTNNFMVFREKMGGKEKNYRKWVWFQPPKPFCQPTVPRASEDDRQDRDKISPGNVPLESPKIP